MIEVVGLVTARGGSKGIPRKNIKPLAGKPLIAWTIEAALASRFLSRVIVSTDDDEIMETARDFGAEVPFKRPAELAGDDSPHISVVRHAVDWLCDEEHCPEFIMVLQPPTPLRIAADIDGAIELAEEKSADAVVSVVEAQHHPYITRRLTETDTLTSFVPSALKYSRRQEFSPAYALNGVIYLNRCTCLADCETLAPEGSYAFVMPPERSIDVDTPWDFHLAELILNDRIAQCTVATEQVL
ncbi:MAG: acylneuraminate cytidylyltransferase family protein [Phycisphaerales bacterium]|nr:MAG: acylneuraminate cytidylyltransferase family protein [Phycisphaerales bacterium]